MLTFGSKFNRRYGLYLPFKGDHIGVDVFYHKSNAYVGFVSDDRLNRMCTDNVAKTKIVRDLDQSSFAKTFLDLKDVQSHGLDIRNQFYNIKEKYKDSFHYVTNETVKLLKLQNPNQPDKCFESVMYIYVLAFSDYPEDFLYVLAERQHIDTMVGKKLVRTYAFQICSNYFYPVLNEMMEAEQTESVCSRNELTSENIKISEHNLNDLFDNAKRVL